MIYLSVCVSIRLSVNLVIYVCCFCVICAEFGDLTSTRKVSVSVFVSNNAASSVEKKEQEGASVFLLLHIYAAVPANVTVT